MRIKLITLVFFALLMPIMLSGEEIRAVVLPKLVVENQEQNGSSLESLAVKALQDKKMRVVELSATLSAQKAMFSDAVQQGKVPNELTVLSADALVSIQLVCDKNSGSVLGSGVSSYFCTFNTKVIRIDSGDIVYTESKDFTAHGMNALQATQLLIKKQISGEVTDGVAKWTANWQGDGKWNLDIVVTGLADKQKANLIAEHLGAQQGVESARMVMFMKDFCKYTVTGNGAASLKQLKERIDTDPKLSLRINYEAGRMIHAEFDFGQAYSKAVKVFLRLPKNAPAGVASMLSGNGAAILKSYLQNLDYFDVKDAAVSQKENPALAAEAKQSGAQFALVSSMQNDGNMWLNTLELLNASTGKAIVSVTGTEADPFGAMDKCIRDMDGKYRKALQNKSVRSEIGFGADVPAPVAVERLLIEEFDAGQLFPALMPFYRVNGVGAIKIKNVSARKLEQVELRYMIGEKVAGTAKLQALEPGKSEKLAIKLDVLPENGEYNQLSAQISYKDGETYGRKDAYSPLVIHKKNAIDWTNPLMVSAFIDPNHPAVRDLATKAIASAKPNGLITKQLANAALIFSALMHQPLKYVSDPVNTSFNANIDTVQFPGETIKRLAGDCDDLTVLLASLYESVGLATVIITTPGHVFLGVESGTLAGSNVMFDIPGSLFVNVDGALFLPVEATAIGSSFPDAWIKAADMLNKNRNQMQAFRVREAWKSFPTFAQPELTGTLQLAKIDQAKVEGTLAAVRAAAKNDNPAWAKQLNENLSKAAPVSVKPEDADKKPLAKAILSWLAGDREKAIALSGELCAKDVVEACYNMTIMGMYDALERNDVNLVQVNMEQQNYSDAVSVLPKNVVSMLLDNGGLGMGDEASKESATKKKLAEVLKAARAKIAEKKSLGAQNIKTAHVGGRKGANVADSKATAGMFFWDKVN